jgi:hypothetical protein
VEQVLWHLTSNKNTSRRPTTRDLYSRNKGCNNYVCQIVIFSLAAR